MKDPAKAPVNRVCGMVASLAFLIAIAIPVQGQSLPSQPADTTNTEKARQQDMSKREWQLRNLATEPERANDPNHVKAVMAQVEQDFKRILTLHNEIARAISAEKSFDYNFISDATTEIKKRASRLQSTLALHKPEGEQDQTKPPEFTDGQMKDALIKLCKEIKSFVTNPIIETPGTVDARQLAKARRDLEDVIELSGNLRKSADRLKKAVQ